MRNQAIWFATFGILCAPAHAGQARLDTWFNESTGIYMNVPAVAISRPDYLPGTTRDGVCRVAKVRGTPVNSLYELQAYDPAHHLALANFFTDGCNVVLFSAVLPSNAPRVRNADLSSYHTGRGLSIGSSYAEVRRLYGGPRNSSARFVVRYRGSTGTMRGYSGTGMVDVPEQIVILVENQRVKSIAVMIDLSVLT